MWTYLDSGVTFHSSQTQAEHGNKWQAVAEAIPGRCGQQCAQRWRHKLKPGICKEKWTAAEDAKLKRLVAEHGNKWADVARCMDGRTDQQCMGRWRRHLDPEIKRTEWSTQEDRRLMELHREHENDWSSIAREISNRTPQQCRARFFQARFTGRRFLSDDGDLLTPRSADKVEKEIEFAKSLAAAAGKTLRPNGANPVKNILDIAAKASACGVLLNTGDAADVAVSANISSLASLVGFSGRGTSPTTTSNTSSEETKERQGKRKVAAPSKEECKKAGSPVKRKRTLPSAAVTQDSKWTTPTTSPAQGLGVAEPQMVPPPLKPKPATGMAPADDTCDEAALLMSLNRSVSLPHDIKDMLNAVASGALDPWSNVQVQGDAHFVGVEMKKEEAEGEDQARAMYTTVAHFKPPLAPIRVRSAEEPQGTTLTRFPSLTAGSPGASILAALTSGDWRNLLNTEIGSVTAVLGGDMHGGAAVTVSSPKVTTIV